MGRKYIIEIIGGEEGDMDFSTIEPYTEPDTEAAYAHGYSNAEIKYRTEVKEAYQKGLSDAWDAARKIGSNSMCSLKEMGFDFSQCAVSDYNPSWFVVKNYSASEAIEKIRQYEQEQEEQIQVGDEVIYNGTTTCVVFCPENDKRYASIIDTNGVNYSADHRELTKTGRHFPEIAEVLQKMKES